MKINFKSQLSKIKELWKQYWIYIIIMLISAFVRGIPLSSGNPSLDDTMNDIAIGAFASTLVAWLIDCQMQRKNKRKNEILRAMILIPFVEAVVYYMEQFCFRSAFMPPEKRSVMGTFLEWTEEYYQRCKHAGQDENFLPLSPDEIIEIVESVDEHANEILRNEIWLCKENIMTRGDIDNIKKINSTLYQYHLLCHSGKYLADNIRNVNESLAKILLQIRELAPMIQVQYSYDCRLSRHINSLEGVEL